MIVLAIETATPACALGLLTYSGEEISAVVDDQRHHTEALAPGVRDLLHLAGIAPAALDRVVVDRGPGLFTGLRVGIATAVGLALGANADLVGVTSLELLAHGAQDEGVRGTLVCAVDGRRGEVFVQTFDLDEAVVAREAASVNVPVAVAERWSTSVEHVTFTGDGAARYREVFAAVAGAANFDQRVPPPIQALRLGAVREPVAEIVPLYLREADAVANFATRERRP